MLRDLGICVIVLGVSSSLAIATNLLRERPLSWMREKSPESPTTAPVDGSVDSAGLAEAEQQAADSVDSASPSSAGAKQGVVTMDEVLAAMETASAYLVDAREQHEFDAGRLRGSLHLPSSAIYRNIEPVLTMIPTDARVIVYCGGGQCEASHNVADALRRDFGYSDVVIYEKGWEEAVGSGRFGEYLELGGRP